MSVHIAVQGMFEEGQILQRPADPNLAQGSGNATSLSRGSRSLCGSDMLVVRAFESTPAFPAYWGL